MPLITLTQRFTFLAFLGFAMVLLPACGGSGNVKSQKAAETVLSPETTPTPVSSGASGIVMAGENHGTPINTYVEKFKRSKSGKATKITLTPGTPAATPDVTPVTTPVPPPPVDTTTPPAKTGGSHWIWWVLLVLVLGGVGWFLKNKNQSGDFSQPNPPVGGLSPVSGFTGVKNNIEDESDSEPSFWSKKLF